MKRFASILIIIVLMFGLVGCGGNETPQKVDKTEQTSTETQQEETESKEAAKEEEPSQEIFNIGDSIQIGDVIVTVNSAFFKIQ